MPSPTATLSALLLATTTTILRASATSITFQNASPHPICYSVELTSGSFPTTTTCGPGSPSGISVPAGQTTRIPLDANFNGALTAWTTTNDNNNNDVKRGARYEVNFAASPGGSTWYDADYQLGMSDGTIGALDNRKLSNGLPSVTGEADTLAKANAAWPQTDNKAALLAYPDYLKQGADGKLDLVYCDARAPQAVIDFFQVTAEFDAYIDAGSVAGVSPSAADAEAVKLADAKSLEVDTQDMLIVAH